MLSLGSVPLVLATQCNPPLGIYFIVFSQKKMLYVPLDIAKQVAKLQLQHKLLEVKPLWV